MGGMTYIAPQMLRGQVVTPDQIIPDGVVAYSGDTITFVGAVQDLPADLLAVLPDAAATPSGGYILPGLVDVHSHGGGGGSFPNAVDETEARTAITEHLRHGTTSYVASLVTASADTLRERVAVLAPLVHSGELAGIHFEGPFLSEHRCGAQDPALMQTPDPQLVSELLEQAQGAGFSMTIAAEIAGNIGPGSVTEALINGGALPSFGHTDAADGQTRDGLAQAYELLQSHPNARSGRPTVTHLFNGMRPLSHREAGPIPDCLAAAAKGQAVVELVADGVHLHPQLVTEVFELVGRENIVLITDAMAAAGLSDGAYSLGSMEVTVTDGVARLVEGGAIAGGTAHLLDVVRSTVAGGVELVDAVYSASMVGATVLGMSHVGGLVVGKRADVLVTDAKLHPVKVLKSGGVINL